MKRQCLCDICKRPFMEDEEVIKNNHLELICPDCIKDMADSMEEADV